jgi:hypothetical protein
MFYGSFPSKVPSNALSFLDRGHYITVFGQAWSIFHNSYIAFLTYVIYVTFAAKIKIRNRKNKAVWIGVSNYSFLPIELWDLNSVFGYAMVAMLLCCLKGFWLARTFANWYILLGTAILSVQIAYWHSISLMQIAGSFFIWSLICSSVHYRKSFLS